MRIVFMGTTEFAATILREIAEQHEVVGVFSRPDAVRGRGKSLVASEVKTCAESLGLPCFTPSTLRNDEAQAKIRELNPDVICVAAYGAILPRAVLDTPRYGCLNVHASLLPRWRGAAPIERAILAGDKEAGVCIMNMEEGLDTGKYCISRSIEVGSLSAHELTLRLADLGAVSLLGALTQLEQGGCLWTIQDESEVTYADKVEKSELNLSPVDSEFSFTRKVQASSSQHPARCVVAGKSVAILSASPASTDEMLSQSLHLQPGVACVSAKRFYFGVSNGAVRIDEVKPAGKRAMDGFAFAAGIQNIKSKGCVWSELDDDK